MFNRVLRLDFKVGSAIRILSCSISRVLRSLRLSRKGAGNQVQVATAQSRWESLYFRKLYQNAVPIIDFLKIVHSEEVYAKLC